MCGRSASLSRRLQGKTMANTRQPFLRVERDAEPKQPYYIHKRDGTPMAFAGLWETWKAEDQTIESCAIITTAANDMVAQLHNGMPVILDAEHFHWWMTGSSDEVGQLSVPETRRLSD
jgi:putative SOS response-associated peptidase YedK